MDRPDEVVAVASGFSKESQENSKRFVEQALASSPTTPERRTPRVRSATPEMFQTPLSNGSPRVKSPSAALKSPRAKSSEPSSGFTANTIPFQCLAAETCIEEDNWTEEQLETFRQQYLRTVSTVPLRNAVSQHPAAQPWSEKNWAQRLKIAQEILPTLQGP